MDLLSMDSCSTGTLTDRIILDTEAGESPLVQIIYYNCMIPPLPPIKISWKTCFHLNLALFSVLAKIKHSTAKNITMTSSGAVIFSFDKLITAEGNIMTGPRGWWFGSQLSESEAFLCGTTSFPSHSTTTLKSGSTLTSTWWSQADTTVR